jgi:hypothetical protein
MHTYQTFSVLELGKSLLLLESHAAPLLTQCVILLNFLVAELNSLNLRARVGDVIQQILPHIVANFWLDTLLQFV